ncbi:MAG: hypothetical protein ABEJ03_05610 [Candidatus Nanohaloarchaea archaeon]
MTCPETVRQKANSLAVFTGAAVIAYYSMVPFGGGDGSPTGGSSALLHLTAYFGLAAGTSVCLEDGKGGRAEAFLAVTVFGAAMEVAQGQVPSRFFSYGDIAYNSAGASLVLADPGGKFSSRFARIQEGVIARGIEAF